MTTVAALMTEGIAALQGVSPSPRLDIELLLGGVTGLSRAYIVGFGERPVKEDHVFQFRALLARRVLHEPIAYLVGRKEFFGLDFEVNAAVLVPRPETELIVERGIEFLESRAGAVKVLDLGTGSGCISLALGSFALRAGRRIQILAVDKSSAALTVAAKNAQTHGLTEMVTFCESDWFGAVTGEYNLIVSNPPYVEDGSTERSPETDFEPKEALFSGSDGLRDIECILRELPRFLAPQGLFLCEIGATQGRKVMELWDTLHPTLPCHKEVLRDFGGLDRVFVVDRL